MRRIVVEKIYRKRSYKPAGTYTYFAGGNAHKRAKKTKGRAAYLEQVVNGERKHLGI